ncbi:MAG: glycosyltransferase family 4 protein, partial [Christensenellales bacterium]
LQIRGGIMVALRHATMLQDAGYDVMLVDNGTAEGWCQYEGHEFPVVQARNVRFGRLDKAVATMWVTEAVLEAYPNIRDRYYLVQNFETDFYEPKVPLRIGANMTYRPHVPMQFVTISKWCQNWLAEDYGQQARYARNGIDTKQFAPKKRDFSQGKIRILIEGDCGVYYKNVDESFRIVDKLDPDKYEIWYMSYNAKPKAHYRVDKFLHQIPYEKVAEVYHQCHILIKSSFLESFSYPPLEMMATGGYSVVVPNGGNQEYLRDGENCLLYPCGDVDAAVAAIERIVSDEALRDKLYEGGVATAQSRSWPNLKAEIGKLYDLELS